MIQKQMNFLEMTNIVTYITEKLKIGKNINVTDDIQDPSNWTVGDIIGWHGFHIEFGRIKKKEDKKITVVRLGIKMLNGAYNSVKYEVIPREDDEYGEITLTATKDKNVFKVEGRKYYTFLWDGNPVKGNGLIN